MKNKKLSFPKITFPVLSPEQKRELLKLVLILTAFLASAALILSGLFNLLRPLAERREEKRILSAMEKVFPADSYEAFEHNFDKALGVLSAKKVITAGETTGYCIETSANGYENRVHIVVGIDLQGAVTGVEILSIKETPGYGDRIDDYEFLSRFNGKNSELTVVRGEADDDNEISAVSGATVSSNAIKEGVNHAIAAVSQLRAEEKAKEAEEAAAALAAAEAAQAEETVPTEEERE